MKLNKFLSTAGLASRRAAAELVKSGAVTVDGAAELNPAREVTGRERICCRGRRVRLPERHRYILLHKPRGYVCSSADAHAEKLALDLIRLPGVRLRSAGRLDKESEGALLFSDDGEFINFVTHPGYRVLKRYEVSTAAELPAEALARMRAGIADGGEVLRIESGRRLGPKRLLLVLNEGRKREIRRLTARCGAETVRLRRLSVGPVELGDLPCGSWRDLTPAEVAAFRVPAEADKETEEEI